LTTPILILSALGEAKDKIPGFDAGADQYLTKSFHLPELLARVRSLTKWGQHVPITAQRVRYKGIDMNLETRRVTRDGRVIDLTAREFALLEFLMRHQRQVLSKPFIVEHVWAANSDPGTNVVEAYMNSSARKTEKGFSTKLIHTLFGLENVLKDEE
jgi:two-component system copper resistance phosphate regulon response regulator CusR